VRRGRVVGRRGFVVDKVEALDTAGLAASFVQQLYGEQGEEVPREILLPVEPADAPTLRAWLATLRGRPVDFRVPRRGEKRALLETVERNAKESFVRHKLERASDFDARAKALKELQEHLDLPEAPLRIECFDISNLQADHIVASMVVFEDGLPRKSEYRRFEIRTLTGQDDFAAMREVIGRRLARLRLDAEEPEGSSRRRFAYPPNLIVIDGGRGQLGAALEAVEASEVPDLPVVSLAKRMEEVYIPGQPEPLVIPRTSEALYLLQRVRDEAHRFAVTYHRKLRGKAMTRSALDAIPGIGETRRKQLVRHFGSVKKVREADLDQLKLVPGLGDHLAEIVYQHLHGGAGTARAGSATTNDKRDESART
jgi:excinuclease ABC subunit C